MSCGLTFHVQELIELVFLVVRYVVTTQYRLSEKYCSVGLRDNQIYEGAGLCVSCGQLMSNGG